MAATHLFALWFLLGGVGDAPMAPPPILALSAMDLPDYAADAASRTLIAGATAPLPPSTPLPALASRSLQPGGYGPSSNNQLGAFSLAFYQIDESEFRLGDFDKEWDEANRFELLFHSRGPLLGRIESMIGGYVFFEEREFDKSIVSIDAKAFGAGAELGAMFYPLEGADTRKFNLGIMPFFRLGIGGNDGDFENVPVDLGGGSFGLGSGDLSNLRFEAGLGAEIRAVFARKFFAGVGVGYNWWTTSNAAGATTRVGTVIIVQDDELEFSGDEGYARVSVGLMF